MASYLDPGLPDAFVRLSRVLRESILVDSQSMSRIQLSNTKQRESVRQAIDEGIHLLASLKSYRNYVASISFLPNEILARIFLEYVLISNPWSGKWTKIILVCRRWYDVALANPVLWSWIDHNTGFGSASEEIRADCWMDRSKNHPIKLRLRYHYSTLILLQNYRRIKTLHAEVDLKQVSELFEGINELPVLEQFSLQCWNHREDEDGSPELWAWFVPSFIVHGGAPRLRSLALHSITFANKADFHLLSNLTHLKLERLMSGPDNTMLPSLLDLAAILQRSPQLQALTVIHYIDYAALAEQCTLPPAAIPLLELQCMVLNMNIVAITALLQCLKIPLVSYLNLVLHRSWANDDFQAYLNQLQSLLIPLRLRLRSRNFPTLRSIHIESSDRLTLAFSEQTEFPRASLFSKKDTAFLITVYPECQKEVRKMLSKIMHAVPLDKVSHIDASVVMHDESSSTYSDGSVRPGQFSSQTWRKLFGLLLNPIEVKIGVNDAMHCMLDGAIEVIQRGPHKLPLSKSARRLAHSRGCPFFDKIHLLASRHPDRFSSRRGPDPEEQQAYYENLLDQLAEYQNVDGVSKPKGAPLAKLKLDEIEGGYTLSSTFAPRLFEVTEQLIIFDAVWDPAVIERREREMRELAAKLGVPI